MNQRMNWTLVVLTLIAISTYASTAMSEYVKTGPHYKLPTQKLPDDVYLKITTNAEKRYPGNDQLRQNTIDTQTRAYLKVIQYVNEEIPAQEMVMIKRNAAREFPDDFVRQLVNIDKRAKLYVQENRSVASQPQGQ